MTDIKLVMGEQALPCIKCGKQLPNFSPDTDNQPCGGTEFWTYGHYGSAVTDLSGTKHFVCVCDDCLRTALDLGHAAAVPLRGRPDDHGFY